MFDRFHLVVGVEKSHNRDIIQLVASLEEGDLDDEEVADKDTSKLLDEVACSRGGTTWGKESCQYTAATCAVMHGHFSDFTRGTGWSGLHTSGNDVVHHKDCLPRLDGILLQLEVICAVLLQVLSRDARARQLALLADGHEAGVQPQGQRGAEQEASGVQADDDVGLDDVVGAAEVEELQLEGAEEGGVGGRVKEPWHNIQEVDTGDGEVGKTAEGFLEG